MRRGLWLLCLRFAETATRAKEEGTCETEDVDMGEGGLQAHETVVLEEALDELRNRSEQGGHAMKWQDAFVKERTKWKQHARQEQVDMMVQERLKIRLPNVPGPKNTQRIAGINEGTH